MPEGVLDSQSIAAPWFAAGTTSYTGPDLLGGVPWPPEAQAPCHIQISQGPDTPQPYVLAGDVSPAPQTKAGGACDYATPNELWTFVGGEWKQRHPPQGAGFNMFGVHPRNPQRLYAATLDTAPQDALGVKCCGVARMFRSSDGGASWEPDDELTELMHGRGKFLSTYQDPGDGVLPVPQPVMVAFNPWSNPHSSDVVVAGGRESGLFLSSDGGDSWALLTDPFTPGTSGVPHLPRPFFVHFERYPAIPGAHPSAPTLHVGSQGRGVWRIRLTEVDLSITKSDTPDPVLPGQQLTYAINVKNAGPDVAHNVELEDALPAQTTFKSIKAPPGWSCAEPTAPAQPLRCRTLEMLPKGNCCLFTVVVTVNQGAPPGTLLTNTARVVSASIDRTPSDNTVAIGTGVKAPGGGSMGKRVPAAVSSAEAQGAPPFGWGGGRPAGTNGPGMDRLLLGSCGWAGTSSTSRGRRWGPRPRIAGRRHC